MMSGVYAPIGFGNTSWPDSTKNDCAAQLHKFLESLTDTKWKMAGKTVLYIPNEGEAKLQGEEVHRDKELVQRLETAMIHWTRQIKEVLSSQDALETSENAGPLEEVQFYRTAAPTCRASASSSTSRPCVALPPPWRRPSRAT